MNPVDDFCPFVLGLDLGDDSVECRNARGLLVVRQRDNVVPSAWSLFLLLVIHLLFDKVMVESLPFGVNHWVSTVRRGIVCGPSSRGYQTWMICVESKLTEVRDGKVPQHLCCER